MIVVINYIPPHEALQFWCLIEGIKPEKHNPILQSDNNHVTNQNLKYNAKCITSLCMYNMFTSWKDLFRMDGRNCLLG